MVTRAASVVGHVRLSSIISLTLDRCAANAVNGSSYAIHPYRGVYVRRGKITKRAGACRLTLTESI